MRAPSSWLLLLLSAACGVPSALPVPLPEGVLEPAQDPKRFETCTDPAGQRSYDEALVQLQAGKDRQALPLLRDVIERCPDHVVAHRYFQEAALHVGGDAAAEMTSYYKKLPDRTDSPVPAYAKAALLATDYERSQALSKLLSRFESFPWGHLSLARVQRRIGRLKEAAESYRRTLELHRGLLEAYLELAETLVELGSYQQAAAAYDNYLRAVPNDRATIQAFAQVLLYRLGNADAARPWVQKLLQLDPSDAMARMDMAAVEWRAGKLDAALTGYVEVLSQEQVNSQIRARAALNIGNLHYEAFGSGDAQRRAHWPKARKAYLLYQRLVRPEEGQDQFDRMLGVPYRMKEIAALLGPDDGLEPAVQDLK